MARTAVVRGAELPVTGPRIAAGSDRLRHLWLRLAGGGAEAELLRGLARALRPGNRVLDAGSAPMAWHVHRLQPAAAVTRAHLAEVPGLGFPDGAFDVVVCAWSLEVVPEPHRAFRELARVVAPGGTLLVCYRSEAESWLARASTALLRRVVGPAEGRALRREEVPLPELATTRIFHFAGGLTTLVCGTRSSRPA